ncbi:MAG TPA: RNA polymerase sigma factor [Azospirillum sp.]|nr:RNA polymerase sigma factor [Azospirillum sp.]
MRAKTFAEQVADHRVNLVRFAHGFVRTTAAAEDLAHDTMLRALERSETFQTGSNLRAWLFTILRNLYINDTRRPNVVSAHLDDLPEAMHGASSGDAEPRIEMRDLVRAMRRLPESQRRIVVLVGAEGLSYEEAGRAAGVNTNTVKSRLSRGRSFLAYETGRRTEVVAAPSDVAECRIGRLPEAEVIARYRAGVSSTALARAAGTSTTNILNKLHAAGVAVRPRRGGAKHAGVPA